MQILLYQGRSMISKLIRAQTRSIYSHAAVRLTDGTMVEAWQSVGVRRMRDAFDGHSLGTLIDVHHVDGEYEEAAVEAFLLAQLGTGYDYKSVARFLSRRDSPADAKWFCSELVMAAFSAGGLELLNGPPSHISPRDLSLSPYIRKITTVGGS